MKRFSDFINEAKAGKGKKDTDRAKQVVVLSNMGEPSGTIAVIKKGCEKIGVKCRVLDIGTYRVKPVKGGSEFVLDDDSDSPVTISPDDTAIMCRAGVAKNTKTMALVALLEDNRFFVVNSLSSITSCKNKYMTAKILQDNELSVPRMALVGNDNEIEEGVKAVGGKFPIVIKLLSGSHGIGVSIIESETSLRSVLQTIWKVSPSMEILMQEKIEASYDLRIHVLNYKLDSEEPGSAEMIGCMKRGKVKKDFRTNFSLGGSISKVKLTPEQEKLAIDSARAIGCQWCGVDIIVDEKSGKNYVLEINSSPGTKGIMKATGIDIVGIVVDFITDKSNWATSKRVVAGFREVVEVEGIGRLVAKMDTGNGTRACSISYDKMEELEGGKVKWKIGSKEITSKVVSTFQAEVGTEKHDRKVVELDITFDGRVFKNVRVALVDRTEKSTPFLANRRFLQRVGCTVDPMKTFLLSDKPKGYAAADSKGEAHGGIEFAD